MNNPSDDQSGASVSSVSSVRLRMVCLALFCGTLLLFSRAINHSFIDCDDPDYVTKNVHVQAGLTWPGVRWAFTSGDAANWFPVTWLSHMLDWQLLGSNTRGPHAVNIFWHSLSAVMAFLVLRRLTGAFWTSAVSAALFGCHPLRVESVAWVAERKDVLSVFFGLLTLWAYAVYAEKCQKNDRGAWRFYALTLIAFATGLLCKPMLVTLPCLMLLLDWWPLQRVSSFQFPVPSLKTVATDDSRLSALDPRLLWGLVLEKLPFFAMTIASCIITYHVQKGGSAVAETFSFGTRLANVAVSVVSYIGKFLWPFNLALGYQLPDHWPLTTVAGATALILVITGVALRQWRRQPWLLTGWFWFIGMLVPVIGIVQVGLQAMADRYTYLPVLGLQLALLCTLREAVLHPAMRKLAPAAIAVVLALCAARTWNQLGVWQNSKTLYEHAIAVTKDNYLAYSYLATTLLNEEHYKDAERCFRRAIEIKPDYAAARYRLGVTLEKMGRTDEAMATYMALLKIRPNFAAAHYSVGTILLDRNQPTEAISHFQIALRKNPAHDPSYVALGIASARLGQPTEAVAYYEKALALNPNNAEAHYNYANALVSLNRDTEAVVHYETALQLNADFGSAHFNYADLLRKLNRLDDACAHYRRAIQLEPKNAEAHFGLGAALEELGRTNEALASYKKAVEFKPDYADAQYNVGVILLNQNYPADSMGYFQSATNVKPEYVEAFVGLGMASEQLGRFPEAIASFEHAMRLNPDFPGLAEKLTQLRRDAASSRPQD